MFSAVYSLYVKSNNYKIALECRVVSSLRSSAQIILDSFPYPAIFEAFEFCLLEAGPVFESRDVRT